MFARLCAPFVVAGWLILTVAAPLAQAVVTVPPPPTQPTTEPPPVSSGPPPVVNDAPEPATIISAVIGAGAAGIYAWRRRRSAQE